MQSLPLIYFTFKESNVRNTYWAILLWIPLYAIRLTLLIWNWKICYDYEYTTHSKSCSFHINILPCLCCWLLSYLRRSLLIIGGKTIVFGTTTTIATRRRIALMPFLDLGACPFWAARHFCPNNSDPNRAYTFQRFHYSSTYSTSNKKCLFKFIKFIFF